MGATTPSPKCPPCAFTHQSTFTGDRFTVKELLKAGYTVGELREARVSAGKLVKAGVTLEKLKEGGYDARALREVFQLRELTGVFSLEQLRLV